MPDVLVGSNTIAYGTDEHDIFRSDQPGAYIINGNHTLVGGAGDDWYYVTGSAKIVEQPGGGDDIVTSATSYVLPDNVETLNVWGTSAAFGNNQANTLVGSSQSNLIDGMGGNDILQGGGGADTYQFSANSGHDTITDWNSSSKVRFAGYDQFHSLGDVEAAMTQVGDDVILKLSGNDDVTFSHTKIADFTANNFQYRLDTSNLTLSFDDEFDTLSTRSRTDSDGTWQTEFSLTSTPNGIGSRTLASNGERQLYVDPEFQGTSDHALGLNPFSVDNGVLTITAAPTPEAVKDALSGYDYTSGYLSTDNKFAQTYGYFEARLQLASGQGAWPAFWMFRQDGQWPPELDIMEAWNDSTAVQTLHTAELGFHQSTAAASYVPNGDTSFHNYGMMWTAETLTWYLDGVAVASQPTPADMHSPMFMVLNLALSGSVQDPDFTSQMKVDYVHAYTLDNMPIPASEVIDPTTGHVPWGKVDTAYEGFNAAYYLAHNPDVAASGVTPITHYAMYGKFEGRLPYEGATLPTPAAPANTGPDPLVHDYWGPITGIAGGFNAAYYLAHNPDVAAAGLDPLAHWRQYGFDEGRQAYDPKDTISNPNHSYWGQVPGQVNGFNSDYYGTHNPDVLAAGLDPLTHYLKYGMAEGRAAFDPTAPAEPPVEGSPPVETPPVVTPPVVTPPVDTPPVVTPPVVTPPVDTPPVVTPPVVTAPVVTPPVDTPPVVTPPVDTPPVATDPGSVPTHPAWSADPNQPYGFNAAYYAAHNPDVVASGLDLLDHYQRYGKAEGRLAFESTVPGTDNHVYWGADSTEPDGFNAAYYAAHNPDVVASGLGLLDHYERYGKAEGRLAFDNTAPVAPAHVYWGADPGAPDGFNAAYYAAHNPDVVAAGLDLLDHYERYGKAEGRLAYDSTDVATADRHPAWGATAGEPDGFNASYYAAHNPDVVAAGVDLLDHYEQHGKAEGRLAYDASAPAVGTVAHDDVTATTPVADATPTDPTPIHATTNTRLALDQTVLYLQGDATEGWANATKSTLVANPLANSTLHGGAGDDHLIGGAGNDQMIGGAGHDTFTFAVGSGSDTITDFKASEDTLDVAALISKYGAPTVTDMPSDAGSMVHFAGGETILLLGVSHADAVFAAHA